MLLSFDFILPIFKIYICWENNQSNECYHINDTKGSNPIDKLDKRTGSRNENDIVRTSKIIYIHPNPISNNLKAKIKIYYKT